MKHEQIEPMIIGRDVSSSCFLNDEIYLIWFLFLIALFIHFIF